MKNITFLPSEDRKELPNKSACSPDFVCSPGVFSLCGSQTHGKRSDFLNDPQRMCSPAGVSAVGAGA